MAAPHVPGGVGTGFTNTSRITDVTDFIYQIKPEDKPLFTQVPDGKAYDPVHQWQKRTFNTRQHNANERGFLFEFITENRLPTREFNFTQIFAEQIRVADSEKNTSHYAIEDLFSDQMQLALTIMGTNMEHAMWRGSLASGTSTSAAPQMQGLMMMIYSAGTLYTAMNGQSFTEALFNGTILRLWEIGAEAKDIWVGGRLKQTISAFVGSSQQTRYIQADQERLVRTISEYQTDFWPAYIHLSRDIFSAGSFTETAGSPENLKTLDGNSAVFTDMTFLKKAWLQPVLAERTARIAHSTDGVLSAEFTQEWGHPHAHAWIAMASAS